MSRLLYVSPLPSTIVSSSKPVSSPNCVIKTQPKINSIINPWIIDPVRRLLSIVLDNIIAKSTPNIYLFNARALSSRHPTLTTRHQNTRPNYRDFRHEHSFFNMWGKGSYQFFDVNMYIRIFGLFIAMTVVKRHWHGYLGLCYQHLLSNLHYHLYCLLY